MTTFLQYIGNNYEGVLEILRNYKNFDEDVFHQTILNCDKTVQERNLSFETENDMLRYFIGAYKMNLVRQTTYYYNKNVQHDVENNNSLEESHIEEKTDLDIIFEDLNKHFGETLVSVYKRYVVEEISIADLQKQTGIKNLKQKIKNIKLYVQKTYQEKQQ